VCQLAGNAGRPTVQPPVEDEAGADAVLDGDVHDTASSPPGAEERFT
jgi:hypothetical protein